MRPSLLAVLLCACHPLSLYVPPELPAKLELGAPSKVEVLIDDRGIPHIYAGTLPDASFGLGFMHARDRLFQVMLLQHASQGRLTELFGERMFETDKRLRLVAWNLDAHVAALSDADRRIIDAYVAGLNAGARHAGQSAELAVLRKEVPTFKARDALGIMRLQAWQLAVDHIDEIVRLRLLEQLSPTDPRRMFLDAPVSTGGVSITGSGDTVDAIQRSLSISGGPAASNSWVVDGAHTTTGKAVLANDPHLDHTAPGVFYLVHVETPDFMVAGATLPGGPVVVIGHGRHVAWGMTSSFADAQDLLHIKVPKGRDDVYELDGELVPFERAEQKFVIGDKTVTETWRGTRFGPLLPEGYPGYRADDQLALMWGGFVPADNSEVLSGFVGLAAAKGPDEVKQAIEKIRGSGQNVVLAFGDGSVAYRLAAFTPLRPEGELGRLPRDGSKSANAFAGFLGGDERPAVEAPTAGFVVTANQRVIGDGDPRVGSVGTSGVSHSRAQRIRERIAELLARPEAKASPDELLAIQSDTSSPEARWFVPRLAALCPAQDDPELCAAVKGFDGQFTVESRGAMPYLMLVEALALEVVTSLGLKDEKLVEQVARTLPIRNAMGRALLWPEPQTLIDAPMVARAAKVARARLNERAGRDAEDWRYGDLHTLTLSGALGVAPIIGGYFRGRPHEVPGSGSTVRAESGLPVRSGSCLRMLVEMSDPPVGRFTLDTGQSGHPSNDHWMDMFGDWDAVTPRRLPTVRAEVEAVTRARVELLP
ncbi:MAG: penicillin acylase family protein [Myxococcaceae bacterium]|nr:penicillin acylase family protein [Myxococcaceae bacterium]